MITFLRPGELGHAVCHAFCLVCRLLGCGFLVAAGCVTVRSTTHVEHGARIAPADIGQIVIGQTTRGELFKRFGPPHSMFKGKTELLRYENVGFYSYVQNRPLTAFGEGHYALLYRFDQTDTRTTLHIRALPLYWNGNAEHEASFTGDELLIFLDGDTHIVVDVASRSTAQSQ